MITRRAERTALGLWIFTVAICVAAVGNVALDPTRDGAWRALIITLFPMGICFRIWRQRRRTRDGTI